MLSFLQIFSIAILVTAGITLSSITAFDDGAAEDGYNYEGVSSHRAAAGWVMATACAAILLQIFTVTVRILQRKSVVKLNKRYVLIVSIVT